MTARARAQGQPASASTREICRRWRHRIRRSWEWILRDSCNSVTFDSPSRGHVGCCPPLPSFVGPISRRLPLSLCLASQRAFRASVIWISNGFRGKIGYFVVVRKEYGHLQIWRDLGKRLGIKSHLKARSTRAMLLAWSSVLNFLKLSSICIFYRGLFSRYFGTPFRPEFKFLYFYELKLHMNMRWHYERYCVYVSLMQNENLASNRVENLSFLLFTSQTNRTKIIV